MSDDDAGLRVRFEDEAPVAPEPWTRKLRRGGKDLVVALVGFALLVMGVGWLRAPGLASTAPELAGTALDGTPVRLSALKGQPVLLNFWATWCMPCQAELPELVHYAEAHPGTPVLFVAVDGEPEALRRFAQAHDMPLDRVLKLDAATKVDWVISTLPTTVGIAPDGAIRGATSGIVLYPQLWWWGR